MGHGIVGLEPDRLRSSATASSSFPCSARASPRLKWAPALSGWSRMATRNSATASSNFPWAAQGRCRGCAWAKASSGLSRIAVAAATTARSRNGAASAARPLLLQVTPQATQVARVLRPSIRQVAEDRFGLVAAAHPLEQVGQLVGRLGPEGAGRRVVPHRLVAGRRPQPVQGTRPGRS